MNDLTQRGIAALKAGDRVTARWILGEAVKQDPKDVLGWLWLSGAVESDEERIIILQHVLELDPENQAASRGLKQTLERRARASDVSTGSPPSTAGIPPQPPQPSALDAPPASTQPEQPSVAPFIASETTEAELGEVIPLAIAGIAESSEAVPTEELPAHPISKQRKKGAIPGDDRLIFRTRPSLVHALVTFWLFFIGSVAIGMLLSSVTSLDPVTVFLATTLIGLAFELIVIYVAIQRFRTRYQLTGQHLSMPFRGRQVIIPIADIYGAVCHQSFLQKILSIGDVWVDAVVESELAHPRLRDIPDCQKRTNQIINLVENREDPLGP